ncbi:MAG TPA: D-aminoacyl-tRNA deacylase [Ktedonobacteraceae bacterium]|nr:D-aminoacyl-tRNA deacylase [Ktedonobacteraceae bacterium]
MRALIQRVSRASVTVEEQVTGEIGKGLLIFLGIGLEDTETTVKTLADKIVQLRIFSDQQGKMNLSLLDIQGEILVVSQFTLHAEVSRGRRPSFTKAAPPSIAIPLYELFKETCKNYALRVENGIFGAYMHVELCNDGPVTIWMDSEEL